MTFTFYYSSLCPRCAQARKHLRHRLGSDLEKKMRSIDVVKHPVSAWQAGIRMIPALKVDHDIESGIILSPEKIDRFLVRHDFLRTDSE